MPINSKFKIPKIVAGDLNTPVTFFEYQPNDSPEPGEAMKQELFMCTALIYNPSMKDTNILESKGTKEGVTLKIRDPHKEYQPTNKHKVEIHDFRYQNKIWEIVDVSFDFEDNRFIKVILGMTS